MPEFELENLAFKKQDADANNQAPEPVDSATKKLIEKGLELKKYRLLVEDLEKGKKELASKHETVMEVLHEKNSSIHALNARVLQLENVIEKLNCELNCTKKSLEETECHLEKSKSECSSIRQSSYFKKLQRREKELEKDAVLLQQHKQKGCDTRINALKKQIKSLQTVICNKNTSSSLLKSELSKVRAEKKELEELCDSLQAQLCDFETHTIETRTVGNQSTADVIKTIIELIGEAEVPAARCSKIIHIVSKHIHHVDIPLSDLPSERTSLRFADQGHVLAKYHIANNIDTAENFDLHSDGTTKDHIKYMGHQLTLSSGQSLSTGFTTVFKEDTPTLLEVAIDLLQELCDIYDTEKETEQQYRTMLSKMVGLMSDRASVMKSFDKIFNEHRKELLQTDESLEFLHCNAHFLLGLSSEADKAIKQLSEETGEKFGRDQSAAYKRFACAAETSASRYIRLACDSLGPRGDAKSGCRDSWEAICDLQGGKSMITSFRSNRFNKLFQGAAGFHFHRSDIVKFFMEYHKDQ